VFEPQKHVSLRALPGMQERCIRLGSAGKTFSFTAWKVRGAELCRGSIRLEGKLACLGLLCLASSPPYESPTRAVGAPLLSAGRRSLGVIHMFTAGCQPSKQCRVGASQAFGSAVHPAAADGDINVQPGIAQ
jgi:hypothetical protein